MNTIDFNKLHRKTEPSYIFNIILNDKELSDDDIIFIALVGLIKNNPKYTIINVYNLYNYICSELNNISQQIENLINQNKSNVFLSLFCIPNIENEINHDFNEIKMKMFSFFNNNPEFIIENFNEYKENVNKFLLYMKKNNFIN